MNQIPNIEEKLNLIKTSPAYLSLTKEQGQLDEDGICISVSRQALDETLYMLEETILSLHQELQKVRQKTIEEMITTCEDCEWAGSHSIYDCPKNEDLRSKEKCYCKDKGVIELIEENKKDWLRDEIVKLEGMKQEIPTYLNKRGHHTNSAHRKIKYNQALDKIIQRYHSELD